jgi:hypothetical protein
LSSVTGPKKIDGLKAVLIFAHCYLVAGERKYAARRIGLPFDLTISALKTWAQKNRPNNGKPVRLRVVPRTAKSGCKTFRNYHVTRFHGV